MTATKVLSQDHWYAPEYWREATLGATPLLAALAAAKLLIQFAGINHYGFFRDELYYMACGEHLAWGYVDQPPLIAFVAWIARHLFGNSLVAMRDQLTNFYRSAFKVLSIILQQQPVAVPVIFIQEKSAEFRDY